MPPRIFIIASHGSMPMEENKTLLSLPVMGQAKLKKVVAINSPVDIFTTASFGCSFVSDLRCNEPFVDFIDEFKRRRDEMEKLPTKTQLRKLIKDTLLHVRDLPQHADVLTEAENKIRCHKKGRPMTDLFLFGTNPAVPVIENVTMIDVETGQIQDVHRKFGLVKKKKITATRAMPPHKLEEMAMLEAAKTKAESDLAALMAEAESVDPYFIQMKADRIQSIDDTIAYLHKESKFEYSAKMKKLYKEYRIKLSDLLKNGIDGGLINPDTDFVVVYACRVPDDVLLGAHRRPRDSSDSERSVGGTISKQKQKQTQKQKCKRAGKTCKRR